MPTPEYPPHDPSLVTEEMIEAYVDRIKALSEIYDFARFTVGTRMRADLPEEKALNLRKYLNRRVALAAGAVLPGREPVIQDADATILLTYPNGWVSVVPNPLFIYGRYLKFTRDLPQARWMCPRCHGQGCYECDKTGKVYPESVEEIIAAPLLELTHATGTKMHATGRQDVDVRMLGNGRPFVLELIEPKRRFFDLAEIAKQIAATGRVEVHELRYADRAIAKLVDTARADKEYRAEVVTSEPVPFENVLRLAELSGSIIRQQTPQRVAHRRADMIRERKIHELKILTPMEADSVTTFEIEVLTEAGAYIKELISSDEGRTNPSFSGLLGVECQCSRLDVVNVHFSPF